ncbi:MAG: crossover junction endodeoxyribonuclease RuvC [Planctomycetota bacterium]
MPPTRILGIDPGTRVVGYGVIDAQGSQLRAVAAGVVNAPARLPIELRLARIAAGLRDVVVEHRPGAAAMEDVFVDADPRSALKIGFGRGAILAVLGEAELAVASYPPATVKKAVTGNGRADKSQVARMVSAVLGLDSAPEPADATDALAVAITHALRGR